MGTSRISKRPKRMAAAKGSSRGKITFVDLPMETQKEIFRNVKFKDLHNLLRVSKHFFSLSSAELYRDLDFKYTTSEAPDSGLLSSRLADAFQTVVASEHEYGHHIKIFRYGISEENSDKALLMARVLFDVVGDPCKMLNTALLLMVRKATILESFQWDIPVELSGEVYRALHKIQSLRHLRLRLDVPMSTKTIMVSQTFLPTPPVPNIQAPPSNNAPLFSSSSYSYPPPMKAPQLKRKNKVSRYDYWANGRAFSGFKNLSHLTLLGISNLDCLGEIAGCLQSSSASLKSVKLSLSQDLAVKSRKPLAPIPIVDETSDTEPDEDDEDVLDAPPHPTPSIGQPVNEADIRKEKIAQEAILARIFDLQGVSVEGKKLEKGLSLSAGSGAFESSGTLAHAKAMLKYLYNAAEGKAVDDDDGRMEFLKMTVKAAVEFIDSHPKKGEHPAKKSTKSPGHGGGKNPAISNPPKYYLGMEDLLPSEPPGLDAPIGEFGVSTASSSQWLPSPMGGTLPPASPPKYVPESGDPLWWPTDSHPVPPGIKSVPYPPIPIPQGTSFKQGGLSKAIQPGSLPKKACSKSIFHHHEPMHSVKNSQDLSDDLYTGQPHSMFTSKENILETVQDVDSFQATQDVDHHDQPDDAQDSLNPSKPLFPTTETNHEDYEESMDIDMEHPDEDTMEGGADQEIVADSEETQIAPRKRARFDNSEPSSLVSVGVPTKPNDIGLTVENGKSAASDKKSPDEAMQDYVRAAHGLQLEEFSLYLIPVKASIVARGLDLTILKRLTLLDVRSQDAFWLLLTRLQTTSSHISLKSVHTDDVSHAFLQFLQTFEGLTELFMFERNSKLEADSASTRKLDVSIISIRKKGLRKHAKTLKRLMIKNENDNTWDLDAKTIKLLSLRGNGLTELAVSLDMGNFHILMQNLSAFKNLQALHFLTLRTNDRAILYMDTLHSAVDSFSHIPDSKIEWIALENHLRIIVRRPDALIARMREIRENMKRKAKGKGKEVARKILDVDGASEDSSETDLPDDEADMRLRAEIKRHFSDAQGIRIFEREMRTGML